MEDLNEQDLDVFLQLPAQREKPVTAKSLQRRETVRQGHETTELPNQTNVFDQ
jgi:hypothetical protein